MWSRSLVSWLLWNTVGNYIEDRPHEILLYKIYHNDYWKWIRYRMLINWNKKLFEETHQTSVSFTNQMHFEFLNSNENMINYSIF